MEAAKRQHGADSEQHQSAVREAQASEEKLASKLASASQAQSRLLAQVEAHSKQLAEAAKKLVSVWRSINRYSAWPGSW